MAATLLALPLCAAVLAAFGAGLYGIVHLRLYGFVFFAGALACVRTAIALIQAASTGRSPVWFEEQDLNDEEVEALRSEHR